MTLRYPNKGYLYDFAEEKKKNPTEAELNFKNFCEMYQIQYTFQKPVYCDDRGYILDFEVKFPYNKKGRTIYFVVEIDGGYHMTAEQKEKDKQRTQDLLQGKYEKVIRIKNEDTTTLKRMCNAFLIGIPKKKKSCERFRDYIKKQRLEIFQFRSQNGLLCPRKAPKTKGGTGHRPQGKVSKNA